MNKILNLYKPFYFFPKNGKVYKWGADLIYKTTGDDVLTYDN